MLWYIKYNIKIKEKFMKILIKIIKITSLALLFAIVLNFTNAYLSNETGNNALNTTSAKEKTNNYNNNQYNFKKSNVIMLSNIWVALSTNIGIKYKQRQTQNLYKELPVIAKIISTKQYANKTNSTVHLLNIKEYYNVLNTDIKKMVLWSYNKKETLEAYIEQLKYRYDNANLQIKWLLKKKQNLLANLKKYSDSISKIKIKINKDFKNFDVNATQKNINNLLINKNDYNYSRTYLILTNQYISQYNSLNRANKILLKTLTTNKEAIIRNTHIVIPKTWINSLRKLDLIIDEK